MTDKIKALLIKYRELIVYVIVGGLTTLVSWLVCFLLKLFMDTSVVWQNSVVNVLGWVAGVAFAFPTNRRWVFRKTGSGWGKELAEFVSSRISTLILEVLLMNLLVNLLGVNYWISKLGVAVIVVITNYVLSKFWVFRKTDSDGDAKSGDGEKE